MTAGGPSVRRTLRAFMWLRWRLVVNAVRGGQKRDRLEQVSRALALMIPIILVALSIGSVVGLSVMGFLGGRALASGLVEPRLILTVLRVVAFVLFVILIVFSITAPVQSTLTRYTRLLLLPISTRTLHLVEVGAAAADPWVVLAAPGLLCFALGLAQGGRPASAAAIAATGVLYLSVLACLGSLISFLVAWLFRSRRRGEMLTLVFVLGLSLLSMLPALFSRDRPDRSQAATSAERTPGRRSEDFNRVLIWTRGLPSQLYGDAVEASLDGRTGGLMLATTMLAGQAVIFFAVSGLLHARLVRSPEGAASRRRRNTITWADRQVPFASAATSAVAVAQFRSAMRTVRGRLVVLLPGPMLALMMFAFGNMPDELPGASTAVNHGYLLLGAGVIFALYAMQAFTMNLFGADRAGLTMQFLAPVSDLQLARGKVVGTGLMYAAAVSLCLVAALVTVPTGSPLLWTAVLIAGLATYLWLSPLMVWLSALFPLAADLSKTGSGGNPHPVSMLAGTAVILLAAAPSVLIVLGAGLWWHRPWLGLSGLIAWAAVAWLISTPLVALAARTVGYRRENLALVAQGVRS